MDVFKDFDWDYLENVAKYRKNVEKDRVSKFLLRLNKNLDEVREKVFGIRPLPAIQEAFYEVHREESRKKIIIGNQSILNVPSILKG